MRDFHCVPEAGLRSRPIRLWLPEHELTAEPVQLREPEPFAGLLDKGKALLEAGRRLFELTGQHGRFGKVRQDHGASGEAAGRSHLIKCRTKSGEVVCNLTGFRSAFD